MKYFTSALVVLALFSGEQVNTIRVSQGAKFTDDLVKSLAEEMQKDTDEPEKKEDEAEKPAPAKAAAPAKPAAPQKPVAAAQ